MDINQFTLNAQKAVQAAQSLASEHKLITSICFWRF